MLGQETAVVGTDSAFLTTVSGTAGPSSPFLSLSMVTGKFKKTQLRLIMLNL